MSLDKASKHFDLCYFHLKVSKAIHIFASVLIVHSSINYELKINMCIYIIYIYLLLGLNISIEAKKMLLEGPWGLPENVDVKHWKVILRKKVVWWKKSFERWF